MVRAGIFMLMVFCCTLGIPVQSSKAEEPAKPSEAAAAVTAPGKGKISLADAAPER